MVLARIPTDRTVVPSLPGPPMELTALEEEEVTKFPCGCKLNNGGYIIHKVKKMRMACMDLSHTTTLIWLC